jgi:wobble nucleotide-excising tRNase
MDSVWFNDVKWIVTVVFSAGIQVGVIISFQKSVREKFAALSTKIMSLEKAIEKKEIELDIIKKDIHRSDLLFTEIKVIVQNLANSLHETKKDIKDSLEKLEKRIYNE